MEPQTICHVIVKVAEQIILEKYCNCSSFGVTMDLLNSQNFKIAISYPMCNRSETLLCDSLPKSRWITYLKIFP